MFSKIVASVLILVAGSFAHADEPRVFISPTRLIDLKIAAPSIALGLSYPGKFLSGLCGFEIRTDGMAQEGKIRDLLNAIVIQKDLGVDPIVSVRNGSSIQVDLTPATDAYGTYFSIHTRSGQTLRDTINATLGAERTVVLVATTCGA